MKWHHSLYSRIAVGFVACLALLLLVQGILFVWVASRSGSSVPNQPPDRFAQTIALDVTQEIERDPTLVDAIAGIGNTAVFQNLLDLTVLAEGPVNGEEDEVDILRELEILIPDIDLENFRAAGTKRFGNAPGSRKRHVPLRRPATPTPQ